MVYLAGTLIHPGALASFRPDPIVHSVVAYAITFVVGGIIAGPLFEEPGWRGFALARLERTSPATLTQVKSLAVRLS